MVRSYERAYDECWAHHPTVAGSNPVPIEPLPSSGHGKPFSSSSSSIDRYDRYARIDRWPRYAKTARFYDSQSELRDGCVTRLDPIRSMIRLVFNNFAFDSTSAPRDRSMDDPLLTKPGPSNPNRCAVTRRVLRSLAPVAAKNATEYSTPQLDAVGCAKLVYPYTSLPFSRPSTRHLRETFFDAASAHRCPCHPCPRVLTDPPPFKINTQRRVRAVRGERRRHGGRPRRDVESDHRTEARERQVSDTGSIRPTRPTAIVAHSPIHHGC